MLKTQTIDERGVAWGDIKGKPSLFKPTPHDHDVGDLYGWEYVVNQLTKIREAILISDKAVHEEIIRVFDANATSLDEDIEQVKITILDRLSQHTARTDNPHGTTKAQAGPRASPKLPTGECSDHHTRSFRRYPGGAAWRETGHRGARS